MSQALRLLSLSSLLLAVGTACGGSAPPPAEVPPIEAPPPAPEPTPPAEPAPTPEAAPETPPTDTGATRPALTAEQCTAQQGTAVGDIGDGAIHRPDYMCPSGKAPLGNISAAPGGPVAVEGEVCCPK